MGKKAMPSSAAEEDLMRKSKDRGLLPFLYLHMVVMGKVSLLQSMAEKLLPVEVNPRRPKTINSVFLNLNVIPYVRCLNHT